MLIRHTCGYETISRPHLWDLDGMPLNAAQDMLFITPRHFYWGDVVHRLSIFGMQMTCSTLLQLRNSNHTNVASQCSLFSSPQQLQVREYFMRFIPTRVFTCKVCPATRVRLLCAKYLHTYHHIHHSLLTPKHYVIIIVKSSGHKWLCTVHMP